MTESNPGVAVVGARVPRIARTARIAGRDRIALFRVAPVSTVLAGSIAAVAVLTGTFWREIPTSIVSWGAFGWPSLEEGRWWTLLTSLLLTRNWFMAVTMPIAVLVALGLYERRAGSGRAAAVAIVGHTTGSLAVAGLLGWLGTTSAPLLQRAADNLDYGASMMVAAAFGAIAARSGDRRVRVALVVGTLVALAAHRQMADWAHVAGVAAGYALDRALIAKPARAVARVERTGLAQ